MSTATTTHYGKLKDDVKAAWVARLRSGLYRQGAGYLHAADEQDAEPPTFCCLGVLCEIAVEKGVATTKLASDEADAVAYLTDGDDDEYTTLPPRAVQHWAYAVPPDGSAWYVPYTDEGEDEPRSVGLVELNDDYKLTFDEIADLIEQSY